MKKKSEVSQKKKAASKKKKKVALTAKQKKILNEMAQAAVALAMDAMEAGLTYPSPLQQLRQAILELEAAFELERDCCC